MSITANLGQMEVYSKGSPSIESFDALTILSSYHVTDEKRYSQLSQDRRIPNLIESWCFNASLLPSKLHDKFT